MSASSKSFLKRSLEKASDLEHRQKINYNIGKYNAVVPIGKQQFTNLDAIRNLANAKKAASIERLHENLLLFEKKIEGRGAKVIWAENSNDALAAILKICREKQCRTVVKSKSMVTEEIHLNAFLESQGIKSVETDLGEYIQQLDGEPPYHIVTPAMHKSKEDVAKLFFEKLGTPINSSPEELTLVARKKLRHAYVAAEVGVTGANFIVADSGAIVVTENEGNARLSSSFPKTHIVIAGIEKLIEKLEDLALFLPLLSTFGTGQRVTVYNSIISGPGQNDEADGPTDMYVILLDNGRTNLLADVKARQSLYCIRCGACLNACPVYKNIGGHTYATTYSGPVGSVITPHLKQHEYQHLSFASSLCGNCTSVCPVKIELHELLLYNRNISVKSGNSSLAERIAWKAWKQASLSRSMMNMANGNIKDKVVNRIFGGWNKHRGDLQFSSKTFNQLWKERNRE